LIANHSHTSKLVGVLPVELLVKVDAAFRKKRVEEAIGSGDLRKLTKSLGDLIEYVGRLERKWALYGRELQTLASDVDRLRQKMKSYTGQEADLTKEAEAYKQLEGQFRDVADRRKKMAALIEKLQDFVAALEAAREQVAKDKNAEAQQLLNTLTEARARFERLLDRLEDVVSGSLEKAERQMGKIGLQLKGMPKPL
jgi:chromosome segregation ATPase